MGWNSTVEVWEWIRNFIPHLMMDVITYPCWDIRTLHGCPSQMNENLMFNNLSSFVGDDLAGYILYNGKDNRWRINWLINIMHNVRVLSNHERAVLAHQCKFNEKIAPVSISHFKWSELLPTYNCIPIQSNLHKTNCFSSLIFFSFTICKLITVTMMRFCLRGQKFTTGLYMIKVNLC